MFIGQFSKHFDFATITRCLNFWGHTFQILFQLPSNGMAGKVSPDSMNPSISPRAFARVDPAKGRG
jgi:hypothetical protein